MLAGSIRSRLAVYSASCPAASDQHANSCCPDPEGLHHRCQPTFEVEERLVRMVTLPCVWPAVPLRIAIRLLTACLQRATNLQTLTVAIAKVKKDVEAYIRKNPDVCFLHPLLLARDLQESHSNAT